MVDQKDASHKSGISNSSEYVDHLFCALTKFPEKTKNFYPLIRKLACAYQGVRNVSFSESCANVPNEWSLECSEDLKNDLRPEKDLGILSFSGFIFFVYGGQGRNVLIVSDVSLMTRKY